MYEERDKAYEEWLQVAISIQVPCDGLGRKIFLANIRSAFNAGWEARKRAQYHAEKP